MGVVQNTIDIEKLRASGGDPEIAERVAQLETEIGDENSGIIKDIDDLQEANALIMTSVSSIKTTADSAKAKADVAVLWPEREGYVGKNLLHNTLVTRTAGHVTFTVNADGSINTSGTSDSDWITLHINEAQFLKAGNYIFNGISGGAVGTYRITITGDHITDLTIYDGSSPFTVEEDSTVKVDLTVRYADVNMDGKVFYPMIRHAEILDGSFEAYLSNNNELLPTATLKSVTAAASDFAAFKTAIAAL